LTQVGNTMAVQNGNSVPSYRTVQNRQTVAYPQNNGSVSSQPNYYRNTPNLPPTTRYAHIPPIAPSQMNGNYPQMSRTSVMPANGMTGTMSYPSRQNPYYQNRAVQTVPDRIVTTGGMVKPSPKRIPVPTPPSPPTVTQYIPVTRYSGGKKTDVYLTSDQYHSQQATQGYVPQRVVQGIPQRPMQYTQGYQRGYTASMPSYRNGQNNGYQSVLPMKNPSDWNVVPSHQRQDTIIASAVTAKSYKKSGYYRKKQTWRDYFLGLGIGFAIFGPAAFFVCRTIIALFSIG